MALNPGLWLKENARVYFGNATMTRDFRAQLRGNKPIVLWTAYLGILILIISLAYASIVSQGSGSVANMQNQLSTFYLTVMGLVGGLIALVTPALTATAVVTERQRKSLDLVFSAPVSLKYYLVGKMLSSMRYTWMLLVLSLPVASVCVVMGGATWGDVLAGYAILIGASLVSTSIGLLMSVLAPTMASAVVWTYLMMGAYSIVLLIFSSISAISLSMGRGSSLEAPWFVSLSPFMAAMAAPTHTTFYGYPIPNWIFGLVYSLLITKLIVLGAASAMSEYRSKETRSFRIHFALYVFLIGYLITKMMAIPAGMTGGRGGISAGAINGISLGWITVLVSFAIPLFSCYSDDSDRKFRRDGWFAVAKTFAGTPGGALPYLWSVVLALFGGGILGAGISTLTSEYSLVMVWAMTYVAAWWGCARFTSSLGKGLKAAKLFVTVLMLVVIALPVPVLTIITASSISRGNNEGTAWIAHLLYPIFSPDGARSALVYATLNILAAVTFLAISESYASSNRSGRVSKT